MRRRRGFPCSSAAAAAAGRRCCSSCASGSAAPSVAVHRRRAHRHDARALPARGHGGVAVPGQRPSAPAAGARAAFDATLAFFVARAHRGERAGDVPPRRVPRAADVRELPGPAPRAARLHRRPRGERQPLRADQPLRRAHAAAAARSLGALRSHPHAAAHRRGHARHPRPDAARRRRHDAHDADYLARTVQALADGRPAYVARARRRARARCASTAARAAATPISALAALLAPDGRLAKQCGFCYELRLHRARGYGALKAILEILARRRRADAHRDLAPAAAHARLDEGLSVVARGRRPRRRRGRSATASPTRCCASGSACTAAPSAPTEDDLAREVHRYALPRLPQMTERPAEPQRRQAEPAFAMAGGPVVGHHRDRLSRLAILQVASSNDSRRASRSCCPASRGSNASRRMSVERTVVATRGRWQIANSVCR